MKKACGRRWVAFAAIMVALWLGVVLTPATSVAGEMPGLEQLELAEDFAARAVKRAAEAKRTCDPKLIREALELTEEAVFVTASVAANAGKANNLELADHAFDRTLPIGAALKEITEACRTCCTEKNQEEGEKSYCCDCDLVKATLRLAKDIAALSRDAAAYAKETNYKKLSRTAYACANTVASALADISGACACCSPGGGGGGSGCCCDCDLPLETVRVGKEIAFLVLAETEVAQETRDRDLAGEAYKAGRAVGETLWHMTESWMSWIFCNQGRGGASAWLCFCDCRLIEETMTLGETMELLVSKAAGLAEQEKNPDLVQDAYDMANAFGKAVRGVGHIATHCYRTSMELSYVDCCREALALAEKMSERNGKIVAHLIELGATPERPGAPGDPGPPTEDELPIRDHEQPSFSPVE